MPFSDSRISSRWRLALIALAAGWVGGRLPAIDVGAARAATPLPVLTRLAIEDDIRQRIALYGLYVDGGGPGGAARDLRTLADTLMTADVVSEVHPANGAAPTLLYGRDAVARSVAEHDPQRAGRHYLVETHFDAVAPTSARTRTTAVYFAATRNRAGPACATAGENACGGVPVKTYMWIYEMTWRKTTQGWQIASNVLRNDN